MVLSFDGSWGYFNRRMWVRRQLKLDDALEQADVLPDPQQPMVEDTSYGEGRHRRWHVDDNRQALCAGDASA
jgi:hypothetical protein